MRTTSDDERWLACVDRAIEIYRNSRTTDPPPSGYISLAEQLYVAMPSNRTVPNTPLSANLDGTMS